MACLVGCAVGKCSVDLVESGHASLQELEFKLKAISGVLREKWPLLDVFEARKKNGG